MNRTQQAKAAIARQREQAAKIAVEMVDLDELATNLAESVKDGGVVLTMKVPLADAQASLGIKPERIELTSTTGSVIGGEALPDEQVGVGERAKKVFWGDQRLPMEKAADDSQRLPDKSVFYCQYDAGTKRWKGELLLESGIFFEDDSGAVMKLLKKLDAQYRAWLKDQERARAPEATEKA